MPGRQFDGIGAVSAGGSSRLLVEYPPPQRSEILDYLFKPNFGAALQYLKVEIGSDGNSTDGAEPSHMRSADDESYERGYEWWLMREAKARNPEIRLGVLAWNFPAWIAKADSQAAADYIAKFIGGAKTHYGLHIDYVGIHNETQENYDFVVLLRRTLDAEGLDTKIVADDTVNNWDLVGAMAKSPDLRHAVAAISTHYPRFIGGNDATAANARYRSGTWDKPLWASEDGPWDDRWGEDGQLSRAYAEVLNRNYVDGRITSTQLWSPVSAYSEVLDLPYSGLLRAATPWSGHYDIESPIWIVAHTTQFTMPGWHYIDSASGRLPAGGSYVTLHDGSDVSLIVETLKSAHPQTLNVRLKTNPAKTIYVWRSRDKDWFKRVAAIRPRRGRFVYTLLQGSVYTFTTTTGQTKGVSKPPADRPFPLPYSEDFERYRRNETTFGWFQTQNGAFDVVPCDGSRSGQCLEQLSSTSVIPWQYYGDWEKTGPIAVVGEAKWSNYSIGADVLFKQPGYAMLVGRLDHETSKGALSAYEFRLYDTGRWELRKDASSVPLQSGDVTLSGATWHRLSLSFVGKEVSGGIDGQTVVTRETHDHARGLGGIGSSWSHVQFDNITIEPVPGHALEDPTLPANVELTAPAQLVPLASGDNVLIRWSAVADANCYQVRVSPKGDTRSGGWLAAGSRRSHRFTGLARGEAYSFEVRPFANGRAGPSSSQDLTLGETP